MQGDLGLAWGVEKEETGGRLYHDGLLLTNFLILCRGACSSGFCVVFLLFVRVCMEGLTSGSYFAGHTITCQFLHICLGSSCRLRRLQFRCVECPMVIDDPVRCLSQVAIPRDKCLALWLFKRGESLPRHGRSQHTNQQVNRRVAGETRKNPAEVRRLLSGRY
jgi:hypothetical protein